MFCPGCKAKLRITSPKQVGTRIDCPKCKKRIDVVTPDEDGAIPYGVTALPPPEPEPEPTEEEIEAKEKELLKVKREQQWALTKHIGSILWLLLLLAFFGFLTYRFVYLDQLNRASEEEKKTKWQEPR
jgi:hypothetical protein